MQVLWAARPLTWCTALAFLAPQAACLGLSQNRAAQVDGEHRQAFTRTAPVCFVHVGKCAGGTIAEAFGRAGYHDPASYLHIHTQNGPLANPAVRSTCVEKNIVMFVRDPVQRLISSWRFEIERYQAERIKLFLSHHRDVFSRVPATGSSKWPVASFELNYVAGEIMKLKKTGGPDLEEEFVRSFHHGIQGLSWYVGSNCSELDDVPNNRIFVGRVEHMVEDWDQVRAWLQIPVNDDTSLQGGDHDHSTEEQGTPLSSEALSLLSRIAQPEYACMEKLTSRGLLSKEYMDSIRHKTDFNTKVAAAGSYIP